MAAAVLFALSLSSPIFTTDEKASVVLVGIAAGLTTVFEEIGWTGFATPTLLRVRHGVLGTGLIVGLLWGAWHFIMFWEPGSFSGAFALALLLVKLFSWLPAYRVLMVWVYERTYGSLLLAILMHTSYAACTFILNPVVGPGAMSGSSLLTYDLVLAAALWVVVGAVALAQGGHLSRQPLRRRVA